MFKSAVELFYVELTQAMKENELDKVVYNKLDTSKHDYKGGNIIGNYKVQRADRF